MKTIFSLALFIGWMNTIVAQEYLPLPEANASWVNTLYLLEEEPFPHYELESATYYCTPGMDTTISGTTYFVIEKCVAGDYKGALRNDNGKVWFVPKDSQTEFLLYDFTVQPGDTIFDVYIESYYGEYGVHDLYVGPNAVDSVFINGDHRKRIELGGGWWIEGIGNTQGLFLEPWMNVSQYLVDLACMSENDTTLYPLSPGGFSVGACGFVGIKELDDQLLSVHPNPSKGVFFADLEKLNGEVDLKNIEVLNPFGQRIDPVCQVENNVVRIDMESFPAGIYFIRITTKNKVITQELVKE